MVALKLKAAISAFALSAALAVTDTFTQSNGDLTGNWECLQECATLWQVTSGEVKPGVSYATSGEGGTVIARTEGSGFPEAQYSQVQMKNPADTGDHSEMGPCVRVNVAGDDGVCIMIHPAGFAQVKRLQGTSFTDIDICASTQTADTYYTWRITIAADETYTISRDGSTLTDCSNTATGVGDGRPGIGGETGDSSMFPTFDNFESTDPNAGGGGVPPGIFNNPRRGGGGQIKLVRR